MNGNVTGTGYDKGVDAMAHRVARATGARVEIEQTGGWVMVATVTVPSTGEMVTFTPEGWQSWDTRDSWEGRSEQYRIGDETTPWAIVRAVVAFIGTADRVTITATRAEADFLHSLADIAADDPEVYSEMHPGVDASAVRETIADAMHRRKA